MKPAEEWYQYNRMFEKKDTWISVVQQYGDYVKSQMQEDLDLNKEMIEVLYKNPHGKLSVFMVNILRVLTNDQREALAEWLVERTTIGKYITRLRGIEERLCNKILEAEESLEILSSIDKDYEYWKGKEQMLTQILKGE